MKYLALPFLLLVFIACSKTSVPVATNAGPNQSDVDRMTAKIPEYSLEKLTKGQVLYAANCASCHKLYTPDSRSEDKWKAVVPPMVKKVNKSTIKLSEEDQELILNYLITMCDAPKGAK